MAVCEACSHPLSGKCKFCSVPRRAAPCPSSECAYCFAHTLASHDAVVSAWRDESLAPRQVWATSSRRVRVACATCDKVTLKPARTVCKQSCSLCRSPGERTVYEFLAERHHVAHQVHLGKYWYDVVVDGRVVVEVDGAQHFKPVRSWKSGVAIFEKDLQKEEWAQGRGFAVVRILQEDVRDDASDWRAFLSDVVPRAVAGVVYTPDRPAYRSGVYRRLRTAAFF